MSLFRRNTDQSKGPDATADEATDARGESSGSQGSETRAERRPGDPKGRPTPSRKQAEAERRRRMQMTPKERRKAAKDAERRRRTEAWAARDQTPEKELLRDVIDSRWNLGEFLLPMLLLLLAASVGVPQFTQVIAVVMYSYMALAILDSIWAWRKYRKLLAERQPRLTDIKGLGLRMYLLNRVISLRPMRQPKPRLKRGEKP